MTAKFRQKFCQYFCHCSWFTRTFQKSRKAVTNLDIQEIKKLTALLIEKI
jgi:hypothetical protein